MSVCLPMFMSEGRGREEGKGRKRQREREWERLRKGGTEGERD